MRIVIRGEVWEPETGPMPTETGVAFCFVLLPLDVTDDLLTLRDVLRPGFCLGTLHSFYPAARSIHKEK